MTIEEAIKKAIEGGYCGPQRTFLRIHPSPWENDTVEYFDFWTGSTFLDPSFWQSLGKALGWGGIDYNEDTGKKEWIDALRCPRDGEWLTGELQECPNECDYDGSEIDEAHGNLYEWRYQWHRFIDNLAEGKSAEEYFRSQIL